MTKKSALLSKPATQTFYLVNVQLASDQVTMRFTNKAMAQLEHDRLKAQGIYAGQWITGLTLTTDDQK